ncbi:hypothetical protein MLD52_04755 [Puniceicoccaceae bacterium K14]|nr:hypothetical protein [Puniceicoccaceae bacterium K14]
MKFALLLGGFLGFVAIFATALAVGKNPSRALLEASMGSAIAGLLFRWWGMIWIRNVKQMLMEKQQAAIAAMAEAEERKKRDAKEMAS